MRDKYTDWNWGVSEPAIGIRYTYTGVYSDDKFDYTEKKFYEYPKEESKPYPPPPGEPVNESFNYEDSGSIISIPGHKFKWDLTTETDVSLTTVRKYPSLTSNIVHLKIDLVDSSNKKVIPDLNNSGHYGTA